MTRKVLALVLASAVTLAGVPAGGAGLPSPGGQQQGEAGVVPRERGTSGEGRRPTLVRDARRLGGATTFVKPGLTTLDTLRQMVATPGVAEDLRKVLRDGGVPETADAVLATLASAPPSPRRLQATLASTFRPQSCLEPPPADGSITECEFPVGGVLEWMAFRPNQPRGDRTPGIIERVRWAGKAPFEAFLFRVSNNGKLYTFAVPKDCGNLALLAVEDAPPPPPPPPPPPAPVPPPPPPPGALTCNAWSAGYRAIPNAPLRLRNGEGEVIATGSTNDSGECLFVNLNTGTYVVELLNPIGAVLTTSVPTPVVAGSTAHAILTLGGAIAAAAGGGGVIGILTTTAIATGGGIVAVTKTEEDPSPIR